MGLDRVLRSVALAFLRSCLCTAYKSPGPFRPGLLRRRASRKRRSPLEASVVVRALPMIGEVEAFPLLFLGHAEPDRDIDDFEEDRRADARPRYGEEHG